MQIEFNSERHEYKVDGRLTPSVTQVLKVLESYNGYPEQAALRGTYVHKICELYDQDRLDPESVDPSLTGYLAAWVKFRTENPLKIDFSELKIEVRIASKLGYAGTVDRVSDTIILDIKSGAIARTHPHQLHAYNQAAIETLGGKRREMFNIYLTADGDYRVKKSKWDHAVWSQFSAALTVHNFVNNT
jgi:hypothetical protein